jgi:hypothetical protein
MEQLERELAAANKERDDALAMLGVYKLGCDEQKERIRRLQDAGNEIAFRLRESVFTEDEVAIEEWDHAKEAKP